MMPFTARLIHHIGARTATGLLMGLWCAALALPALAPSLPVLCMTLLVFGACAGTADIAMNAQGSGLEQRMGTSIMSGLHGMWSLGGFIGSGAGALAAYRDVDARVYLAVMALVLLVAGQMAVRALPANAADDGQADAGDSAAPPRFSLPKGTVLVIGLVAFCAVFADDRRCGHGGVWSRTRRARRGRWHCQPHLTAGVVRAGNGVDRGNRGNGRHATAPPGDG